MLIRSVELRDVDAITDIYNGYVTGGSATFETEPVGTSGDAFPDRRHLGTLSLSCLRGGGKSGRLLLCTRLENKSGLPVYARNDGLPFTGLSWPGNRPSG